MTTRRHFMSQTAAAASVMSFPLIAFACAPAIKGKDITEAAAAVWLIK